jgi:hypothetical protein
VRVHPQAAQPSASFDQPVLAQHAELPPVVSMPLVQATGHESSYPKPALPVPTLEGSSNPNPTPLAQTLVGSSYPKPAPSVLTLAGSSYPNPARSMQSLIQPNPMPTMRPQSEPSPGIAQHSEPAAQSTELLLQPVLPVQLPPRTNQPPSVLPVQHTEIPAVAPSLPQFVTDESDDEVQLPRFKRPAPTGSPCRVVPAHLAPSPPSKTARVAPNAKTHHALKPSGVTTRTPLGFAVMQSGNRSGSKKPIRMQCLDAFIQPSGNSK